MTLFRYLTFFFLVFFIAGKRERSHDRETGEQLFLLGEKQNLGSGRRPVAAEPDPAFVVSAAARKQKQKKKKKTKCQKIDLKSSPKRERDRKKNKSSLRRFFSCCVRSRHFLRLSIARLLTPDQPNLSLPPKVSLSRSSPPPPPRARAPPRKEDKRSRTLFSGFLSDSAH
jgi:hypothetical protein